MQPVRFVIGGDGLPKTNAIKTIEKLEMCDGRPAIVTITHEEETRRQKQNRRYWALLNRISQGMPSHMDEKQHTPAVWHEYFKQIYLGEVGVEINGKLTHVTKTSRDLKVKEFTDYMQQVEVFAAEHGIWLD